MTKNTESTRPRKTSRQATRKGGINVRLLRKVQRHILEEPRRLEMSTWKQDSYDAPCGTVACIAGWAAILGSNGKVPNEQAGYGERVRNKAIKLLRLRGIFVDGLFCRVMWPDEFRTPFVNATNDPRERAIIASRRIDAFIAEHTKRGLSPRMTTPNAPTFPKKKAESHLAMEINQVEEGGESRLTAQSVESVHSKQREDSTPLPATGLLPANRMVKYPFPLRVDVCCFLEMPRDLTQREAVRIYRFIRELSVPELEANRGAESSRD